MMAVSNRFTVLLAEKMLDEKRRITVAEVARETGIDQRTLGKWANNSITRYDFTVINALCKYFGCKVDELINYIPDLPKSTLDIE